MSIYDFTIGCDPEIFVKRRGKLVTAHGLIPGDKQNPHPVRDGAIQVDGMALEFNTNPVSLGDFELFNYTVLSVLNSLKESVPTGHSFLVEPAVVFDKDYYDSCPEEAKVLGCDPDFNAWQDGIPNPGPDGSTPLRTASGHIHIGWAKDIPVDNPDHVAICCDFVRELDCDLGLLTLIYDGDDRRRQMYGKAGAFRPKPYGVEYRVPSNAWLTTKSRRKAIFESVQRTVQRMQGGRRLAPFYGGEVQTIINSGNRLRAAAMFQEFTGTYLRSLPREVTKDFEGLTYGLSSKLILKEGN